MDLSETQQAILLLWVIVMVILQTAGLLALGYVVLRDVTLREQCGKSVSSSAESANAIIVEISEFVDAEGSREPWQPGTQSRVQLNARRAKPDTVDV